MMFTIYLVIEHLVSTYTVQRFPEGIPDPLYDQTLPDSRCIAIHISISFIAIHPAGFAIFWLEGTHTPWGELSLFPQHQDTVCV